MASETLITKAAEKRRKKKQQFEDQYINREAEKAIEGE